MQRPIFLHNDSTLIPVLIPAPDCHFSDQIKRKRLGIYACFEIGKMKLQQRSAQFKCGALLLIPPALTFFILEKPESCQLLPAVRLCSTPAALAFVHTARYTLCRRWNGYSSQYSRQIHPPDAGPRARNASRLGVRQQITTLSARFSTAAARACCAGVQRL